MLSKIYAPPKSTLERLYSIKLTKMHWYAHNNTIMMNKNTLGAKK